MCRGYKEAVEDIAGEVLEISGEESDWQNIITEKVGASSWIVHYSNNEEVLSVSPNVPRNDEVQELANSDGDWRDFRQAAAVVAMQRDVHSACVDLRDEFWCGACNKQCPESDGHCPECEGCPDCFSKINGTNDDYTCPECDGVTGLHPDSSVEEITNAIWALNKDKPVLTIHRCIDTCVNHGWVDEELQAALKEALLREFDIPIEGEL